MQQSGGAGGNRTPGETLQIVPGHQTLRPHTSRPACLGGAFPYQAIETLTHFAACLASAGWAIAFAQAGECHWLGKTRLDGNSVIFHPLSLLITWGITVPGGGYALSAAAQYGMSDWLSAEEVRAIRLALGLTQAQFAERIGVTRTFVGLMERGLKVVSKRTAVAIRSARPLSTGKVPTETDPVLRRLESALIDQGVDFKKDFYSEQQRFDFYFPELRLALVVDRESFAQPRPTRDVRDVIVAQGSGAADIISLLLEGRALRRAAPVRSPFPQPAASQ